MAHTICITLADTFQFHGGTLDFQALSDIQSPIVISVCHGYHVHHNITHVYIFGPAMIRGLEEPMFAVKTNEYRWSILLDHLERDNTTKDSSWHHWDTCKFCLCSSGTKLLQLQYLMYRYKHIVPESWAGHLWGCVHSCFATIKTPGLCIISLQLHNDRYMLEIG